MSDRTAPSIDQNSAEHLKRSLAAAQKRNHRVMSMLLEGIDQDASVVRLLEDGGHVNWLVGHVAASRDDVLELLGAARTMYEGSDARYGYGSKPEAPSDAATLESLLAALELTNERVLQELEKLDAARLEATDERGRRLLDRLEFAFWHEGYHVGQLTLYRKKVGLSSPIG
ncbi:MAG: DinB family protein [Trueperaceae bacterium]|nr:DinB family protein [Trueperaceae bacterium]